VFWADFFLPEFPGKSRLFKEKLKVSGCAHQKSLGFWEILHDFAGHK